MSPPPGTQPWDTATAVRVGAVTGAVLGGLLLLVTGIGFFWIVFVTAAVGGAIGFWTEKRRQSRHDGPGRPSDS